MKKILFPTDFSEASLNAFAYALHLAKKIRAEVVTLHMYALPIPPSDNMFVTIYENYEISDLNEFENFKSTVPKLRRIAESEHLEKIKLSHILREGLIVDGILAAAQEERVDYIVLGTTGAGGLLGALFGSVAERVMNDSVVPVLAVPAGCIYQKAQKILFLTQYKDSETALFDEVIDIASHFKAHVDVLEIRTNHKNNEAKMLRKWKSQYIDSDINFSVLISDDVEMTVLKFIAQNKIDIIVMTVAHKGFFDNLFSYSLAKNLTFHSAVPVLGIPVQKPAPNRRMHLQNVDSIQL